MGETKFKKRCHLQQIKSLKHPGTNRIEYISHGLCELHLLLSGMRETLKTVERGAMIENSVFFRSQFCPDGSVLSVQHSSRSYSMFFWEIEKRMLKFIEEYKKSIRAYFFEKEQS